MLKNLIIFLCIFSLYFFTSQGSTQNPNLKYFGFALVDCDFDTPNDASFKRNYIDEVAAFSNIGHMALWSYEELIEQRVLKFTEHGMKPILHIEYLLFVHQRDPNNPDKLKITLHPQARAIWEYFSQRNSGILTHKNIASLYVVDEPIWNGLSQQELEKALDIIKEFTPDIPTFILEAYHKVSTLKVPKTLDWVGFVNYDTIDPTRDPVWQSFLQILRSSLTRDDQKIIIVASTQWLPYYDIEAGVKPEDMADIIKLYHQVAIDTPEAIGLIGYPWPGAFDHPDQLGARDLPDNALDTFVQMGKDITGK